MRFDAGGADYLGDGGFDRSANLEIAVDRILWDLHDFTLVREISSGPTSSTFLARRSACSEIYVIKYLFKEGFNNAESVDRVRADVEVLQSVTDSHLARVYHSYANSHGLMIMAEFVSGVSLRQILQGGRRLSDAASASVAVQCLRGVVAAHRVGVAHRKLQADSIVVDWNGDAKLVGCALRGNALPEWGRATVPQPFDDTESAISVVLECLTGRPYQAQHPSDADYQLDGSLVSLLSGGMSRAACGRPLRASEMTSIIALWAYSEIGKGWEEQGRRELGRAAESVETSTAASLQT
ncbi:protein kinase domain-containing protein [Streptomyces sp. 1222.5]|uniref:protein kinase domain-containing protein n=1 Tax=Streptomyces sp. 1222.5 TaxID=1881026 RepID=UPI003EBCE319